MENGNYYSFECPCCGAAMEVSPDKSKLTCEYCGKKLYIKKDTRTGQAQLKRQDVRTRNSSIALVIAIVIFFFLIRGCMIITTIGTVYSSSNTSKSAVKEVNPFEGINVKVDGRAPCISVSAVNYSLNISKLNYKLDKSKGLSNGDVVTITAEPIEGYKWTEDSYQYTISGCDTIVTEPSMISQEDRAVMDDFCKSEIQNLWNQLMQKEKGEYNISIEPYKLYVSYPKELDSFFYNNHLYNSFKIDFEIDGKSGTLYQYTRIPNALLRDDGTLKAEYDNSYSANGFVPLSDFGVDGYLYADGYKTVLEMESSMEKDNYKLVK